MELYHGTSSIFGDLKKIIPPSESTINRKDHRRRKLDDYVYLTNSVLSAFKYAEKCCRKFGGEPVVYICIPDEEPLFQHETEFIRSSATVSGILYASK